MSLIPREITDEEILSQYGQVGNRGPDFRRMIRVLRDPPEKDMSLMLGQLSAEEMARLVFGWRPLRPGVRHAVRHVSAGRLRQMGFIVSHTPRRARPLHVSVTCTEEWDETVGQRFDSCFRGEDK